VKQEGKITTESVRVLRMHGVCGKVGLGRSSIYELIAQGQFPRPFRLTPGGRAVGWFESDLDAWLRSRRMSSDTNESVMDSNNRGQQDE